MDTIASRAVPVVPSPVVTHGRPVDGHFPPASHHHAQSAQHRGHAPQRQHHHGGERRLQQRAGGDQAHADQPQRAEIAQRGEAHGLDDHRDGVALAHGIASHGVTATARSQHGELHQHQAAGEHGDAGSDLQHIGHDAGLHRDLTTAAPQPQDAIAALLDRLKLSPPQRAALIRLSSVNTLLGARGEWRLNWSDRREAPIRDRTMRVLAHHGLVQVDRRSRNSFSTARLTREGLVCALALQLTGARP